jgi:hypothetical protein
MPEWLQRAWPADWIVFASWPDLALGLAGILLIVLLIIWWRQQTRYWLRIVLSTFLAALLLDIGSFYYFMVPPYYASCPAGCTGWRGYPLPVAPIQLDGTSVVAPGDFILNLLLLWLLWLGASLVWRLLAIGVQWEVRAWRFKLSFVLLLVILPWALVPRILNPPEPNAVDEDQRLAVNARRSAEFTYRITGVWVQRLALEDIRRSRPDPEVSPGAGPGSSANAGETVQVCLRGYTYFYIPWRRYRITLDPSGVTALNLVELPLDGPCWR